MTLPQQERTKPCLDQCDKNNRCRRLVGLKETQVLLFDCDCGLVLSFTAINQPILTSQLRHLQNERKERNECTTAPEKSA